MSGKRILVVDDDVAMVTTLCDVLELYGWQPVAAYDGAEAVELARDPAIDVVLMDIRMPRVNGVQALAEIKARRPEVPVILFTAMASDDLLVQASARGATTVLKKPVELPVLLNVLEAAV